MVFSLCAGITKKGFGCKNAVQDQIFCHLHKHVEPIIKLINDKCDDSYFFPDFINRKTFIKNIKVLSKLVINNFNFRTVDDKWKLFKTFVDFIIINSHHLKSSDSNFINAVLKKCLEFSNTQKLFKSDRHDAYLLYENVQEHFENICN